MRVLITRSSENQTIGGAELSARDQAIALRELGHYPIVSSNVKSIRSLLDKKSVKTYPNLYLQRFTPPLRYIYFWLMLPIKYIYDIILVFIANPDLINPHTREDQISFTLSRWLHQRPVVWKDPGDMTFVLKQKHGFAGSLYKNLYLYAAQKSDHIYLLNSDQLEELGNILGGSSRNRLSAIPSSVLYSDYLIKNDPKHDNMLTYGSICRLSTEKDVASLIKAYQLIVDQLPNSQLLIVGSGNEQKDLEKLAEHTPQIKFTGHSYDVSEQLNKIDILINPALEEGWGRSIKEAMYFGKAIIGSNTGGIAKQIDDGKTGLLFNPGDVDTLASKMKFLAENPKVRKAIGHQARNKALSDGDFLVIVRDKILPIYKSVTSSK